MIVNKIVLLKKTTEFTKEIEFKEGQEFHIVIDVVYMNGYPVPQNLQSPIYQWIVNNPKLFIEIYR